MCNPSYVTTQVAADLLNYNSTSVPALYHSRLVKGVQRVPKAPIKLELASLLAFARTRRASGQFVDEKLFSKLHTQLLNTKEETSKEVSKEVSTRDKIERLLKETSRSAITPKNEEALKALSEHMSDSYEAALNFAIEIGIAKINEVL